LKREGNSSTYSESRHNLILLVLLGLCFGGTLCYVLVSRFYFYEAVLAMLFGIPILSVLLLYRPRQTLLALLILTIPFNPSFHLATDTSTEFSVGIMVYTSDIVVIMIFVYLFISKILNREKAPPPKGALWPLSLPLSLWILAGIASGFAAFNTNIALYEMFRMFRMFLVFCAAYAIVEEPDDIRFIATCLLLALAIQTILVFAEYVFGHPLLRLPGERREADIATGFIRPGGTMGHSGNFAKFATLCLPGCFASIFYIRKHIFRVILVGTVIMGSLAALALTVSRAGIACSLIGLSWIFTILGKLTTKKGVVILVSLTVLVAGLGFSWYLGGERLMNRIQEDGGSALSRLPMFAVAWNMIKRNPILGVGLNNYTLVAPDYDKTPEAISVVYKHPVHNIFLLYAAEMGIPGTVCFIWFLCGTIVLALKGISREPAGVNSILMKAIGVGLACSWIQGLVDWGFRASIVHTSYLGLLAGAIIAISRHQEHHA